MGGTAGGTDTAAQRGAAASGQAGGQAGAAADRSPAQTGAAARQSAAQAGAPGMTTAQGGIQMEGMDPEHRQIMLRLGEARGPDFDKAYIQAQVRAHQQAVDLFTAYVQSGDQADLKLWAAQTLPKLQQHLQRAQQMQQSM